MKGKRIVSRVRNSSKSEKTDWQRVVVMSEKEIMTAAKSEPDASLPTLSSGKPPKAAGVRTARHAAHRSGLVRPRDVLSVAHERGTKGVGTGEQASEVRKVVMTPCDCYRPMQPCAPVSIP
jgi:hypothetical protein